MIVLKSCCSSHVHCTNTPNNHRGKCMLNTTWHFNSLKAVCIIARARVYFRAIAEKRPLSPIMPLFRHHFAFALHTTRILWCSAFASTELVKVLHSVLSARCAHGFRNLSLDDFVSSVFEYSSFVHVFPNMCKYYGVVGCCCCCLPFGARTGNQCTCLEDTLNVFQLS